MHFQLQDIIAGVQNKTACVMAIARQDGEQIQALDKRLTELAVMIELIGLAEHPNSKALAWIRNYQHELACYRRLLRE